MELDSSFRDDYPFISSLFSDNLFKSSDLGNGFCSLENQSSKSLFRDHQDHISESSFLNPHHLNRFTLEGSSKNPLEIYTNGFSSTYTSNPLIPNSANGVLHGSEGSGFWDYSKKISTQLGPEAQIYQPVLMNFQENGSSRARLADEVSCISGENNNTTLPQDQKRFKRMNMMRRERKLPKKNNIIKGQWTPQEDRMLIRLIAKHGTKKWSEIAKEMTGRVGKQCRERWYNHLKPDIKKEAWSEEEDIILIEAHKEVGNKWAEIARRLSGRTENTIKNHWNATKRRQQSKRKHKETAARSTLLQNYIKDVTSPHSARNNKEVSNSNMMPTSQSQLDMITSSAPDWQLAAIGGFSYETDMFSNGCYNFSSVLDEMPSAGSIVESNMEFDMPMEIDSTNYMPEEVKREMELMEMAYKGL